MTEGGRLGVFYGGVGLRLVRGAAVVSVVRAEPYDAVGVAKYYEQDRT